MTEVLITGSSGFIGDNLCRHLVNEGYQVHGVDIEPPEFELPEEITLHQADLTDDPTLPDVDVIVHLAAHSQVQPVVDDSSLAIENIEMTQHVLDEAARMDAAVINASSRDVYGSAIRPSEDEVAPDSANGYAASKLGSEALINAYRHTQGITATSLRLANVYGPRDTNHRVIPIFITLAAAGEELTVYGEGKVLDFVHVDDVCRAFTAVIERVEAVSGEAFNIGSGVGTTLTEVAEYIASTVEDCPGWNVEGDRTGDVERYVADTSKAAALLGYKSRVELTEGLDRTIEWYLEKDEKILGKIKA